MIDVTNCFLLTTEDSATVDLNLAGGGIAADPFVLTAEVIRTPDASVPGGTNLIKAGTTGIYVDCESVQDCVGTQVAAGSDCLAYDDLMGTLSIVVAPEPNGVECSSTGLLVAPSADAGNALTVGGDGRLYTPSVTGDPLALPQGALGVATVEVDETGFGNAGKAIAGLTVTVDVPAGRTIEVGARVHWVGSAGFTTGSQVLTGILLDGVTVTRDQAAFDGGTATGRRATHWPRILLTDLAAGVHTFTVFLSTAGTSSVVTSDASDQAAQQLWVIDHGPAPAAARPSPEQPEATPRKAKPRKTAKRKVET